MFGEKFIEIRRRANLKQTDFAKRLKITSAALSKIERNITRNPRYEILQVLIDDFRVSPDWLFSDKGPMYGDGRVSDPAREEAIEKYRSESMDVQRELAETQKKLIREIEQNKKLREDFEAKLKLVIKAVRDGETSIEKLIAITYFAD
jgi:transcriptional regulator with XRE-family HTH domain